ncbi:methylated-DNA--[protein]-cysteine S-methyltransferase [Brachybacterium phenoliresistens]|uniref:Methylated-DNA--protein-cysteine methyltransferase n=1 Tax=Brachybacterium phenoliresistens TaxID=396014 RepID=Z9JSF9_9MICO|nr:methylated-DNA--[protein]-cysteine S-methyltransferase [Brachybacterium phenoliresistens]EWS81124.1 cysteine methyltransferase [Brachybacterium phenoliresistens]
MSPHTHPATPVAPGTGPARHLRVPTALGTYLIAAEGDAVTGVWREEQAHFPAAPRLGSPAAPEDALLCRARDQLLAYVAGERERFDLPMAPRGTAFQHLVWEQLRAIERGSTTTYGTIARAIGRPRAAQAVGRAVGTNPISIMVPCHRVLASDGSLTGYAGGVETKRALLALEGVLPQ